MYPWLTCRLGRPQLRGLTASAFQVLRLQACAAVLGTHPKQFSLNSSYTGTLSCKLPAVVLQWTQVLGVSSRSGNVPKLNQICQVLPESLYPEKKGLSLWRD